MITKQGPRSPSVAALRRRAVLALALCGAAVGASAGSAVQAGIYPSKPIRMVVPWPAGGITDINARLLSKSLAQALGQPIAIENRAGLSGVLGADIVAKAVPDGHTLLFLNISSHLINAAISTKLPYDTARDFVPVAFVASSTYLIVTHPGFAPQDLKGLVALGRAAPGEIHYAASGTGSPSHLAAELFMHMANLKMTHIPYKGGGPALASTLDGSVPVYFSAVAVALPHVRSGRLRALAITSRRRSPQLPEVPTVAEAAGLRGFEASAYVGVMAPRDTPPAIVAKLRAEIARIIRSPAYRQELAAAGADEVSEISAIEMDDEIRAEAAKWAGLLKNVSVKLD